MSRERKNTPRCGAKAKNGGRCRKEAGWGTDHVGYGTCRLHGGNMRTHRIAAHRQMAADALAESRSVPVLVRLVDRDLIRRVARRVVRAIDGLTVDQLIQAHDQLEAEINELQGTTADAAIEAKRAARRKREEDRFNPTAEDVAFEADVLAEIGEAVPFHSPVLPDEPLPEPEDDDITDDEEAQLDELLDDDEPPDAKE